MLSIPTSFAFSDTAFLLGGKPFRVFSGEMHPFRIPREYWQHRLRCAKAMGLNTVSIYLPWNLLEPRPGRFNFSGQNDIAEFLDLAAAEGLWAILRPGPYICAEWDNGGLPPWLLAIPDIKLRCRDSRYLAAVERYFEELGRRLGSRLCHRAGNILMVQVENEYGAFGNDRGYMDAMVQLVRRVGFDGALYTCDWATPGHLKAGEVSGAVTVANFGSRAESQIGALRRLRPGQPAMCGEFWAGWFDAWGQEHQGSDDPGPVAAELQWMLENDASFNFYMFHGGTSFGLMAGANHYETWAPTVSSYDYRAPLDEAGRPTKKFWALRDLVAQHVSEPLPAPPEAPYPVISIPAFRPTQSASLLENLPEPVELVQPQPMERLGQYYGLILYRTEISGLGDQSLVVTDVHDFAQVRLNGTLVGTLDRRNHETTLALKDVPQNGAVLDILVDTMGRTNFGPKLGDRKGITERVSYGDWTLMNWKAYSFSLDDHQRNSLRWTSTPKSGPGFHRAEFSLEAIGDTWLDMEAWGRGVVWVNGFCLSRYWSLGPQQTVFVPGAWLRVGVNELVVLDTTGCGPQTIQGLDHPVLDRLHPERN